MLPVMRKRVLFPTYNDDFFGRNSISSFFSDGADYSIPAVNIKENDKNFDIEIAAPGFSKKDFNISIENGVLHLSAEKKEKIEEEEDNYTRREFRFNSFERTLTLPETVNEDDNIDATYKHGILKLILNKLPEDVIKHKKIIEIS